MVGGGLSLTGSGGEIYGASKRYFSIVSVPFEKKKIKWGHSFLTSFRQKYCMSSADTEQDSKDPTKTEKFTT